MESLKEYDIAFTGLKLGEHQFDFKLTTQFFDLFEYRDFNTADIKGSLLMLKKESSLDLDIKIEGTVELPCDITNELFSMPVSNEMKLVVKFGEEYDDSRDEVLILPMGEHKFNVAQYFYELSVLAVPLKRISPAASGEKGQEVLARMEPQEGNEEETDPRWDRLKDLLN